MKNSLMLLFLSALILLLSSCQLTDYPRSVPTEPEGQFRAPPMEGVSVYDHLMQSARTGSSLDKSDVVWFAKRLWHDVGIDIREESVSDFEVFDYGESFGCRFGGTAVYYHSFDDAEPPEGEEQSFEECVDDCVAACMEGIDPSDPMYNQIWKLCNRECRITCAHKRKSKGRFSHKP